MPEQTEKRAGLGKKLGCMFGVFIVGLLLIEGAVRIRQYMKHGTTETTVFSNTVDEATGLMIPEPNSTTGGIRISKRGFRNADLDDPKPDGRVRLAFLGASTTFCAEVSSNATAWPHLVNDALAKRFPDRSFDYCNAGVPGYTTEESLTNLEGRVAPLKPDLILIYHATNDLSGDTNTLAQEGGIYTGKPENPSWLAKISLTWYLIEKNLQVAARQRQSQKASGQLKFDPSQTEDAFRKRLETLVVAAKNHASAVALITFSVKVRREQDEKTRLDSCNTSLFYMPYMTVPGLLDGFEAYNRVIREVAQAHGVILIDGEHEIPGDDDHFNDSVHFKDLGCEKMAERVIRRLVAAPAFQSLVQ
ncbi:MAG: SGNH/GDSL hydrolase family protein [Planctomycetota bacterium]|nr:SGNH/GDSL hydrolase family protein [Planctomycetota bacterium]